MSWFARSATTVAVVFLTIAPIIALVSGCGFLSNAGKKTDAAAKASEDLADSEAVTSTIERGPVKVTVEVSPAKPRLSDLPQLRLTIRAEKGVRIDKPPFGQAFGEFLIRDFHEPLSSVDGNLEITRQVYVLEPTQSGKLTIAPIVVTFNDDRPQGDHRQHSIETDAITVDVSTVLDSDAPSLANLRPNSEPVELPSPSNLFWGWFVGSTLATATGAWIFWRIRHRSGMREAELTAQELAWLELEQLVCADLSRTDITRCYVELTGVVRRYIERSTGIHAPEQTTEEFVHEIASYNHYADAEQQRLRDFLQSADLVKFAGYQPLDSDIEGSFERAKRFIGLQSTVPQETAA